MPVPTERLRACEILWSAREIASVALSAEQKRHTKNVFHMLLTRRNWQFNATLDAIVA